VAGAWTRWAPGGLVNLTGRASAFGSDHPDEGLQRGLREGDVSPTGPLCGSGGLLPGGEAGRVEAEALEAVTPLPALLAVVGVRAERRALVLRPAGFKHRIDGDVLEVEFELPRGAFATTVLRELLDVRVQEAPGD